MKYSKTYAGSAVLFDLLADDGWPDDAGEWPERCVSQIHLVTQSEQHIQEGGRLSPSQFLKSLLWNRKRA